MITSAEKPSAATEHFEQSMATRKQTCGAGHRCRGDSKPQRQQHVTTQGERLSLVVAANNNGLCPFGKKKNRSQPGNAERPKTSLNNEEEHGQRAERSKHFSAETQLYKQKQTQSPYRKSVEVTSTVTKIKNERREIAKTSNQNRSCSTVKQSALMNQTHTSR